MEEGRITSRGLGGLGSVLLCILRVQHSSQTTTVRIWFERAEDISCLSEARKGSGSHGTGLVWVWDQLSSVTSQWGILNSDVTPLKSLHL